MFQVWGEKLHHTNQLAGVADHGSSADQALQIELRKNRLKIDELETRIEELNHQLSQAQDIISSRDAKIESLECQIRQEDEIIHRNNNLQTKLNEYWRSRFVDDSVRTSCGAVSATSFPSASTSDVVHDEPSDDNNNDSVHDVVNQIQRWLFMEGGNLRDVESLLTEYCNFCRSVGMPLDRLFVAGMMLHPQMSAYVWKWEMGEDFNEHEVPHDAFEKPNYNPDEPFAVLLEGRAMEYRMNANTHPNKVPPGCSWFTKNNYKDYFALPIYYRGKFVGAMAWSTKSPAGFSPKHIDIFHRSLAALSTVLRLHTNDIVLKTLMGRLQEEVNIQTKELSKANMRLEKANKQVLEHSRQQLKHFAMMSHEIRTPLNGIVGMSNLILEEDNLGPKHQMIRDSIEMITCSADLLSAVVNDVLDYSKLVAGKVEIQVTECNLLQCLHPVLESTKVKALKRNLELRTTIASDLQHNIQIDGRRLQQILYNLLGNALKFGVSGNYIDFQVATAVLEKEYSDDDSTDDENEDDLDTSSRKRQRLQARRGSNNVLRISVKDYGMGITKDDLQKVFEPFQQARTNDPSVHGGTGLGLPITNQLVDAMGGTISVNSEYGKYCEFVVKIPYFIDENDDRHVPRQENGKEGTSTPCTVNDNHGGSSRRPVVETKDVNGEMSTVSSAGATNGSESKVSIDGSIKRRSSSLFNSIRVLIAEDNTINQKVLNRTLQRLGIQEITIVDNGRKAVDISRSSDFDVILMDIDMPVMDGLEATTQIKQRVATTVTAHNPKIVFLTAHALKEYKDKTTNIGADGFVSKPFKLHTVKQVLENLFPSTKTLQQKEG